MTQKTITLMLAAALFALTACSREVELTAGAQPELPLPPSDPQQHVLELAVVPEAAVTRGKEISIEELRKIGVFGYSHAGAFTAYTDARFPDYFLNQRVLASGDAVPYTWDYRGPGVVTKYWPGTGLNVSFFAYAPYQDVEDYFDLYPAGLADPGAPKIDYTVPAGILDQIDLLWANQLNRNYANTNGGKVEFVMHHALTRVDFEVRLAEQEKGNPFLVEITSLAVRRVIGGGTLDLSRAPSDTDLWTPAPHTAEADLARYTMTPTGHGGLIEHTLDARDESGENAAWNFTSLLKDGHHLMLIPQSLGDKGIACPAEVVLSYTVTNTLNGTSEERRTVLPLSTSALPAWQPGQGINYQITITILHGLQIELEIEGFIEGTPWDDENGDNPIDGKVG